MPMCASVIYHMSIFFSAIVHCRIFITLALQGGIPCGHHNKAPILMGLPMFCYNVFYMIRTMRKLIDEKRKD